jgi:serine phosphatase RsbU (regulator of sigma subunit)
VAGETIPPGGSTPPCEAVPPGERCAPVEAVAAVGSLAYGEGLAVTAAPEAAFPAAAARPQPSARLAAWRRWRGIVLPALTLAAVMAVEFSSRQWSYVGYTVIVPMVAANLTGPRVTAWFTGLAVTGAGISVWWEHLWDAHHGGVPALTARLVGLLVGGVMAILASRYTAGRETKLANLTQVAETAQRAILSGIPATSAGGLRLAVCYESAATEAMVGGDLYEMVDSPWGTRLLLGDARGKGLDAVRLASRVLGCFRVVARVRTAVGDIVPDLDREVASVAELDDFVTAVLAEFGQAGLTVVNAGHPDPVLIRDGRAHLLGPPDRQPPLGLGARATPAVTASVRPGDRLLLYTDGIAEARHLRSGAFFPLLPVAERTFGQAGSLEEDLAALVTAVQSWTGGALRDDVALLVVEVPAGAGAADQADLGMRTEATGDGTAHRSGTAPARAGP